MTKVYDAVGLNVPANPEYILAYIDGKNTSKNADEMHAKYPNAKIIRISTVGTPGADGYDHEVGDISPDDLSVEASEVLVYKRRPFVYFAEVDRPRIEQAAKKHGLTVGRNGQIDAWSANWNNDDSIPDTDIAKQYSTGSYDTSNVRDEWLNEKFPSAPVVTVNPPTVTPIPSNPTVGPITEDIDMVAFDPQTGGNWTVDDKGEVFANDGAPYLGGLNNHPEFNAIEACGPVIGIVANGIQGSSGYTILCYKGQDGGPALYRFPRDGSLAKAS